MISYEVRWHKQCPQVCYWRTSLNTFASLNRCSGINSLSMLFHPSFITHINSFNTCFLMVLHIICGCVIKINIPIVPCVYYLFWYIIPYTNVGCSIRYFDSWGKGDSSRKTILISAQNTHISPVFNFNSCNVNFYNSNN